MKRRGRKGKMEWKEGGRREGGRVRTVLRSRMGRSVDRGGGPDTQIAGTRISESGSPPPRPSPRPLPSHPPLFELEAEGVRRSQHPWSQRPFANWPAGPRARGSGSAASRIWSAEGAVWALVLVWVDEGTRIGRRCRSERRARRRVWCRRSAVRRSQTKASNESRKSEVRRKARGRQRDATRRGGREVVKGGQWWLG